MSQSAYDYNGHSRRRKTQNIRKNQQQPTANGNSSHCDIKVEEQKIILPEKTTENDKEKDQQVDDEQQQPFISVKSRHKNRVPSETNGPSKPQIVVTPTINGRYSSNHQDNHVKSNGHMPSSYPICTYSPHNPLPPRFRQQQQQQQQQQYQTETIYSNSRYRRRRGGRFAKRSSYPPDSATSSNDFVPISEPHEQQIENQETESPADSTEQQDFPNHNGYSSESDITTDSPSTADKTSGSPLLSTSTGSPSSSHQRLDLLRSLATSHGLLDDLISVFDTISFSSDELELILDKIASTHILNEHDLQRLKATSKNEKIFERIRDETYRSQAKILAIELQTEKNRILELTKSNADMENTIRQLQQQPPPNAMFHYQQMMLNYQLNLRRLADENVRLQHQINAYAMMPATLNELKQQEQVLHEQIRQMSIRTTALENEVAESERASKKAAEVYKKADSQKQEKIEQMIADINKYKKLDKELTTLRQKYNESEKDSQQKLIEMTKERDDLQLQCEQLKDKLQQYEQTKPIETNKSSKNASQSS